MRATPFASFSCLNEFFMPANVNTSAAGLWIYRTWKSGENQGI